MNGFFMEPKQRNLVNAVVTLVFGLLLLFVRNGMMSLLVKAVGWIIIIVGGLMVLSCVLSGYKNDQAGVDKLGSAIVGIGMILFGVWVKGHPGNVINIVATIVGVLMLFHAIVGLRYAVAAYRVNAHGWWSAAVSGGVTLILALMLLFNPFGTTMSFIRLAGVCLLIDGLGNLLMNYQMKDFF